MNKRIVQMGLAAMLAIRAGGLAPAAEPPDAQPAATEKNQLNKLQGQPVDIAPWAYAWRADRAVQEKPEAGFIPRRLERMDKVYRTAFYTMSGQDLKSLYYEMPELLKPLPPQPQGRLLAGLLWTGGLANYQVQLCWPAGLAEVPAPEAVEVRAFPTPFGWFGWLGGVLCECHRSSLAVGGGQRNDGSGRAWLAIARRGRFQTRHRRALALCPPWPAWPG